LSSPRPTPTPTRGRRALGIIGWVAVAVVLIGGLGVVVEYGLGGQTTASPALTPSVGGSGTATVHYGRDIDTDTANLLELELAPNDHTTPPAFTLTDQHGTRTTISRFKGKSVILTFVDDQCTDLCTLYAEDVVAADKDLGSAASNVVFLTVNANPYYPAPAATKAWTDEHGLGKLTNWYFATGAPKVLESIWNDYGVPVELDAKTRTVSHGSQMFFINPKGMESSVAEYGSEAADTSLFAHAMSQLAVDSLPAAEQTAVAGPTVPPASQGSTNLGATPSATVLKTLGGSTAFSTASDRGKYTVLNFWASTCTACVREMPALENEYKAVDKSKVAFVGIDVSDNAAAAESFAQRAGTNYPLVADPSGSAAGNFAITGLPYTVILSPDGKVLVRHPGALTQEQLDYIIQSYLGDA
jgi:cytochrome oxidase Cu insertion factor (SCO1/SenC/PrrC family)/thiol-disulfide isomerase/thioredoxin